MPRNAVAADSAPALPPFIEDVRVISFAGPQRHVEWLPDGRTALFFRVLEAGQRADLTVAGPRTRALYKHVTGVEQLVRFQFKPGCSGALLGVTAQALTDRAVPLEDIWGHAATALFDDLMTARSLAQVVERVAQAMTLRTPPTFEPTPARLARHAVCLFESGETRVDKVAEQLGVTSRHLRRAFTESVGVGPKDFARALRLQRAVRMAGGSRDWGSIAVDAGYYDQAHLIAEFRDLVGLTPSAFLKRPSARQAVRS